MTTIDTLRSLQKRIRKATKPDRELDARLYGLGKGLVPREFFRGAMNWQFVHPDNHNEIYYVPFDAVSPYTTDPDGLGACVALMREVLPGWKGGVEWGRNDARGSCFASAQVPYGYDGPAPWPEGWGHNDNPCRAVLDAIIAARIAVIAEEEANKIAEKSTDWQCPNCKNYQYKAYGFECDECGTECPEDQR